MTSKRWLAVLLLIVFGAVRMPFEQRIEAGLKAAHFREGVTVRRWMYLPTGESML